MSILSAIRDLFAPRCAGCGRDMVTWSETVIDHGVQYERRWTVCPVFKEAQDWVQRIAPHFSFERKMEIYEDMNVARRDHSGWWSRGRVTRLRDIRDDTESSDA